MVRTLFSVPGVRGSIPGGGTEVPQPNQKEKT